MNIFFYHHLHPLRFQFLLQNSFELVLQGKPVGGTTVVNVDASQLNMIIRHDNPTDPSSVRLGDGVNTVSVFKDLVNGHLRTYDENIENLYKELEHLKTRMTWD